jgi:hypothetical protein
LSPCKRAYVAGVYGCAVVEMGWLLPASTQAMVGGEAGLAAGGLTARHPTLGAWRRGGLEGLVEPPRLPRVVGVVAGCGRWFVIVARPLGALVLRCGGRRGAGWVARVTVTWAGRQEGSLGVIVEASARGTVCASKPRVVGLYFCLPGCICMRIAQDTWHEDGPQA